MSDKPNIVIKTPGLMVPLFLIFLVLKLTNHIDWSWLWVTAPLWIPFAIWGVAAVFFLGLAVLAAALK